MNKIRKWFKNEWDEGLDVILFLFIILGFLGDIYLWLKVLG